MRRRPLKLATLLAASAATLPLVAASAGASGSQTVPSGSALADDGGASWRLEQPSPPPPPDGTAPAPTPVGLGKIGDIQFWAPNRGLLITAGNGSTIPPGLWAYNGAGWHELSTVCGATDGRIAWAGPDEFWTVSDGRPGQVLPNGELVPLDDRTLCHFSGGQVVGSYATPAGTSSSYLPLHAAACRNPTDCWFGGDSLSAPQVGAFHLHWDGQAVTEVTGPQGHAVHDMRMYQGQLLESVRLSPDDRVTTQESLTQPSVLHRISPPGATPTFVSLTPGVPQYGSGVYPTALDFLHLSSGPDELWGAASPVSPPPSGSKPSEVTVVRDASGQWSQVIGAGADPPTGNPFAGRVVNGIAAEPSSAAAWLALQDQSDTTQPSPTAPARVARVADDATVSDEQTLPGPADGVGPKGAADKIACPAPHDCWMATDQGWLFHLTDGTRLPVDTDPAFSGLITARPPDAGEPTVVPDTPPADDSGSIPPPPPPPPPATPAPAAAAERQLALVSHMRTRLRKNLVLVLSFHLAARARVRLLAIRRHRVVARTAYVTLGAGNHQLRLHLDRRRYPTKLDFQSHALAPLPLEKVPATSGAGGGSDSVST